MSKIASRELKIKTLKLYRDILKTHQRKLNYEMRLYGDYFVKTEFTMNHKQADDGKIKIFHKQWDDYLTQLQNVKDIKEIQNYDEGSLKSKMDIDQTKTFNDLKNTIKSK
jgi:hypothetical protein